MRVADYIAHFLTEQGMCNVFTVTGGGAMHLNDALGHHQSICCTYQYHEQACAIAAEGFARTSGRPAVVCVTTGPGGTNALTGVLGAWLDSIPILILSGQVKYETTVRSTEDVALRQLGDQEFDITSVAQQMAKYAVMVENPREIKYHLQKAQYLMLTGRPGPVWLDIPLNVQSAEVDSQSLREFSPNQEVVETVPKIRDKQILGVLSKLKESTRPIVYIGTGIHLSRSEEKLLAFLERFQLPVVAGFSASDCIPYEHPLYVGRPGTIGDRAGNYAVQNADLLIILGCRLNIRQIGYSFDTFAREAYKIMVDIDAAELRKPTLHIDEPVHGDVSDFIDRMLEQDCGEIPSYKWWIDWCIERKRKYPVVLPEYFTDKAQVNPYCFMEEVGRQACERQVMVASNASACICSFQAIRIKKGQRLFGNSGSASMGYGLPAAIGAARARPGEPIICFEGDGSLQMNIQELETVSYYRLPIKLFVLNNQGYHSIRQTQMNFFGPPLVGCTPADGVGFPDMEKLAEAYGITYIRCDKHANLENAIAHTLEGNLPCICEVYVTPKQPFAPRSSSMKQADGTMVSRPLEDLAPFLSREEYQKNMLIKLVDEIGERV